MRKLYYYALVANLVESNRQAEKERTKKKREQREREREKKNWSKLNKRISEEKKLLSCFSRLHNKMIDTFRSQFISFKYDCINWKNLLFSLFPMRLFSSRIERHPFVGFSLSLLAQFNVNVWFNDPLKCLVVFVVAVVVGQEEKRKTHTWNDRSKQFTVFSLSRAFSTSKNKKREKNRVFPLTEFSWVYVDGWMLLWDVGGR